MQYSSSLKRRVTVAIAIAMLNSGMSVQQVETAINNTLLARVAWRKILRTMR